MKTKRVNQKGFASLLLIIIVLAIAGFFVYQAKLKNSPPSLKLAKQTRIILEAKMTNSLDPATGAGGLKVNSFSTKNPVIYLVLQVNKPPKGTKFEYVRYLNEKYVDHKSVETTKDGISYVSFSWRLKNTKSSHPAGNYRVKLYTTGTFEKEVSYQIRSPL